MAGQSAQPLYLNTKSQRSLIPDRILAVPKRSEEALLWADPWVVDTGIVCGVNGRLDKAQICPRALQSSEADTAAQTLSRRGLMRLETLEEARLVTWRTLVHAGGRTSALAHMSFDRR
jgi:hypothetical protein